MENARTGESSITLVVLHPNIEDSGHNGTSKILCDPLAVIDLHNYGKRLKHKGQRVFRRHRQEWPNILRDACSHVNRDSIVDVLTEAVQAVQRLAKGEEDCPGSLVDGLHG